MDNQYVMGTALSWDDLEKALQYALRTAGRFGLKKHAETIGVGQGFQSLIGRVKVSWKDAEKPLPGRFVLKIPSSNNIDEIKKNIGYDGHREEKRIQEAKLIRVHNAEVNFYRLAAVQNFKVPKTYILRMGGEHEACGVIAMDDLHYADIVPIYENVSIAEAEQVIEALAQIHAYSLLSDEWKAYPKVTMRQMLENAPGGKEVILNLCKLIVKVDEAVFTPLVEKLENIFDDVFVPGLLETLHTEMGMPPVLVHGDMWSSNIMWQRKETKKELVAIIDWQIAHEGCAGEDLARFFCSCLSGETRRQNWEILLTKYYMMLRTKMGKSPPFTLEQLKESFMRLLPTQMVLILITLGPMVMVEVKKKHPEHFQQYSRMAVEKAKAIFDDLFQFYEHNMTHPISQLQ